MKNNTTNAASNISIGEMDFFLHNLGDYLPYTCLNALATIFGAFGKKK